MARTAAFRKWNGARMSTHPSPTPFLLRDPLYRVVSCLSSNSHGQRAKSFHFRRKCSVDRSKISRREFEEGFSLPLSLSCLPEIRISFGRKPIARNPSRPGICPKSAFAPHTHTHAHTRTHFHARFFREIRSRRILLFFLFSDME